ncbi:hypothetical protein AAFN88_19715 [Pelagibius sp. CAU 1746]|uniref:hypothetical protein n=1 Tax=Pelagibius sp. CAU 1746 TaxID=3140370 RepID=UPI00325AF9AD
MTTITGGPTFAAGDHRLLDSRNVRPHGRSPEEVQEVLAGIEAPKEASGIQAPQWAGSSANGPATPAQVGGAVAAAETGFRAQQIAQESDGVAAVADDEAEESAAVRAFLDYMSKTPEERYFEAFLKSKGLTQEEYDALPVEDKKALMKEFEEFVKQNVENNSAEKVARTSRSELL